MRREIPLLITAIVGLFMILSFFIPHPWIFEPAERLQIWFIVIAAFAVVLGVGNLIRVNLHRIRRRGVDWGYKVVTLVALVGYILLGCVLTVNLDIRANWITRALGLYEPPRKEILQGRLRLVDRREEVAALLEKVGDDREGALRAVKALGFEPDVAVPDLVDLGPDGVRALDARSTLGELERLWREGGTKREVLRQQGRLAATGLAPVVTDVLAAGETDRRYRLMTLFSLSRDQADDLIDLDSAGIAAVRRDEVQSEIREIDEEKARILKEERDRGSKEIIRNPADWVFKFMFTPLQATMFSLLAFFIASAAFRAFRMRSLEAGLLLGSGILVILGRVPIGQFAWWGAGTEDEFGFHIVMNWIMNVPNSAAMRGILIGAAMGVIVMGLKVILGIERSYLGGE